MPNIPVKGKSITLREDTANFFGIVLTGLMGFYILLPSTDFVDPAEAEKQNTR